MTYTKIKIILGMLFLKPNNANILFKKKTLIEKFNTTSKTLFTIKQV